MGKGALSSTMLGLTPDAVVAPSSTVANGDIPPQNACISLTTAAVQDQAAFARSVGDATTRDEASMQSTDRAQDANISLPTAEAPAMGAQDQDSSASSTGDAES